MSFSPQSSSSVLGSSPPSSPSPCPIDSSPPSSPNLTPLNDSPPGSPGLIHPFAASTKAAKRPRIYEKRTPSERWGDQIIDDDADSSFFASPNKGSVGGESRLLSTRKFGRSVSGNSAMSDFSIGGNREAESDAEWFDGGGEVSCASITASVMGDEQKIWDNIINEAIDNCNGIIDLSGSSFHGKLTAIPPTISDLANLVVLPSSSGPSKVPQASSTHNTPTLPTRTRPFRRTLTEPAFKSPNAGFLIATSDSTPLVGPGLSAKATSFAFGSGNDSSDHGRKKPLTEVQLYLSNHEIERLPVELFEIRRLTVLSLRGNSLKFVPPQISKLVHLRELNVSLNKLTYLPAELMSMKLDRLAIAGNPWMKPPPSASPTPSKDKLPPPSLPPTQTRQAVSETTVHFTVPALSELCFRVLFSPVHPSAPFTEVPKSNVNSHSDSDKAPETNLEKCYALPLQRNMFDLPEEQWETMYNCLPRSVVKGVDVGVIPSVNPSPTKNHFVFGGDSLLEHGSESPRKKMKFTSSFATNGSGRNVRQEEDDDDDFFFGSASSSGFGAGTGLLASPQKPNANHWLTSNAPSSTRLHHTPLVLPDPTQLKSASSTSTPESTPSYIGIANCPSSRHHDHPSNFSSSNVFIAPACTRFTWETEIAGVKVGEGVPVLWRGCGNSCLDFLDPDPGDNREGKAEEKENPQAADAASGDREEEVQPQPQIVRFEGGLGFD
ncbi:hypothetical protein ABKN59_006975 [Abortiporus biennis]